MILSFISTKTFLSGASMASSIPIPTEPGSFLLAAVPVVTAVLWCCLKQRKDDVHRIPGPTCESWLYGERSVCENDVRLSSETHR